MEVSNFETNMDSSEYFGNNPNYIEYKAGKVDENKADENVFVIYIKKG